MVLDFKRVSRAELLAGAAGVALIVFMLAIHWYGVRSTGLIGGGPGVDHGTAEGLPRNAFQSFSFLDLYLLLTALAAISLPLLKASELELSPRARVNLIVGVLGAIAFALILFRMVDPPDLARTINGTEIKVSDYPTDSVIRKIGPWLGLVASAGIAAGALAGVRRAEAGLSRRMAD
jgi:hypothetical protein